MGLTKRDKITYLKIADGKLRRKTTQEDPEAEERYLEKTEKTVYERVYTKVEGYLRDIKMQTHPEYGTSYNFILVDADGEKYSVNMNEDSRYFQSFVEHMPNIDFSQPIEIKPFSFVNDGGQQNIGVAIRQGGQKIENYYKTYDEDAKKSIPQNGLEQFNFKKVKGDKDEQKILRIKFMKFLKAEFKREVLRLKEYLEENQITVDSVPEETGKTGNAETSVVTEDEPEEKTPATKKDAKKPAVKKVEPPAKKKPGARRPF
jgi:hypothetical protein